MQDIAQGIMRCDAHSERTREAVVTELRRAQAAGEMRRVGELADAPTSEAAPARPRSLARAEVKEELAQARANHQMPRVGEL
jgi:hypothetical protein